MTSTNRALSDEEFDALWEGCCEDSCDDDYYDRTLLKEANDETDD